MKQIIPCSQSQCTACPLSYVQGRRLGTDVNFQRTEDNQPQVDILVVNEFPNRTESDNNSIVETKGGYEIRNALRDIGYGDNVAYTNLVRCRPIDFTKDGDTREPTPEEKAACSKHVWEDIERLKPRVVILMGQIATRALTTHERWQTKPMVEIVGETWTERGVTFFPIPSPYMWAFKPNPYKYRKQLKTLINLLKQVMVGEDTPMSRKGHTLYCGTLAEVKVALRQIRNVDPLINKDDWGVGLDTEGQGLAKVAPNGLSCIQFGITTDLAYVIPLDHFDSPWDDQDKATVKEWLRDLFTDPTLKIECWIAHEAKFDLNAVLRYFGIKQLAKPTVDPIFLEFLDDENMRATGDDNSDGIGNDSFRSSFNLKTLLLMRCNFRHYNHKILLIRTQPEGFWRTPMNPEVDYPPAEKELQEIFLDYCGMDAYGAKRLAITQRAAMDSRGYTKAYYLALQWGSQVTHACRAMERNGLPIDMKMLEFLMGDRSPITARIDGIPQELYDSPECIEANERLAATGKKTAGMPMLFDEPLQLFDIRKKEHLHTLFVDVCKLEPVETKKQLERSGKKPAIDSAYYAKHDYHPLIQLKQEYTGLDKLRSSYTSSMYRYMTDPKYVDNQFDGFLHTSFSMINTVTGRMASMSPSVHQIPRADNFAKQCIKSLFASEPGYCLIEADYGQAEVRWWAQMADDQDMIDMFWRMHEIEQEYYRNPTKENKKRKKLECDIHRQVAALMFRVALADVTKDQRQAAKSIVFGAIYGQTHMALAQILKISDKEAEGLQQQFLGRFVKAGQWLTWIEEDGFRRGYVEAPNGRRRHVGPLFEIDENGTKRMCRNSPIQAIASDVMAVALYLQQCWIEEKNYEALVKPCDLIHDAALQRVKMDLDLIREVIQAINYNMVDAVVPKMEKEYGFKMKVPMVADFKMGLRWGHAMDWDQGDDIQKVFQAMQSQEARLRAGEPFWHMAIEDERVIAAKKTIEIQEQLPKIKDARDKKKLLNQQRRHDGHVKYLDSFGSFAA